MSKTAQQIIAEQATGCIGAGDYAKWAESQGYPHCAVVDWTSSAGDWTFIVSKDGETWYLMYQENNYPRGPGFTRTIGDKSYEGSEKDVLREIGERMDHGWPV